MTDVLVRPAVQVARVVPAEPPQRSRTIVVAVDGSESSIEALRWTRDELLHVGDRLRAVTAFAPPMSTPEAPVCVDVIHQSAECARTAAEIAIGTVFGPSEPGDSVDHVFAAGHLDSLVLRESADAALIVLGTEPTRGLIGRLKPSVTKRVTRHATCPVLSVPVVPMTYATPMNGAP